MFDYTAPEFDSEEEGFDFNPENDELYDVAMQAKRYNQQDEE